MDAIVRIFFCVLCFNLGHCFNFVVNNVYSSSDKSFGWSVLLQREAAEQRSRVLVGAPQLNSSFNTGTPNTGGIFNCYLDRNGTCTETRLNMKLALRPKSRIGMTLDGGDSTSDPLVVCAPGWYATPPNDYFATGYCVFYNGSTNNGILINPLRKDLTVQFEGKPQYFNAMGQIGTSLKYMTNGEILLGAPGVLTWRGTTAKINNPKDTSSYQMPDPRKYPRNYTHDESYLGYSITWGKFDGHNEQYVAGAPRGAHLFGQVLLFEFRGTDDMIIRSEIKGPKFGSYFGAALSTAKLTRRPLTLLVGAPTYAGEKYDEGRVFVYEYRGGSFHSIVLENGRKEVVLDGTGGACGNKGSEGARFGSAITNLGRHSSSSEYEAVAIAAPFEKNGRGAIYIYQGLECSQRIEPESSGFNHGFGYSLSRSVDVDSNNFKDVAIGGSGRVTVLLGRPVIQIIPTLRSNVTSLLRNSTEFIFEYCFQLSPGLSSISDVDLRVLFKLDSRSDFPHQTVDVFVDTTNRCFSSFLVKLRPNNVNFLQNFQISLSYSLNSQCPTCPILDTDRPNKIDLEIPYSTDCGPDNICNTNLQVKARFNESQIIIGANKGVTLKVDITNTLEPAYLCKIAMGIPPDVSLKKCPSYCLGTCSGPIVECDVENPLITGKSLSFDFDLTALDASRENLAILMKVSSSGEGREADFKANLPITTKYNGSLTGVSLPDTILANNNVTLTFSLRNHGPSPFENYSIFFAIPTKPRESEENFVQVQGFNSDSDLSCERNNSVPIEYITSENTPKNISTIFDCVNADCDVYVCMGKLGTKLKSTASIGVQFLTHVDVLKLVEYYESTGIIEDFVVSAQAYTLIGNGLIFTHANIHVHNNVETSIPWWIILLAVLGAIILLLLIIFILYKCNFFKRLRVPGEEPDEILLTKDKDKLDQESQGESFKDYKEDDMYQESP